jgi:hypothetical protein
MLDFSVHPHVAEPADMPLVHLPATADHLAVILFLCQGLPHSCQSSAGFLRFQADDLFTYNPNYHICFHIVILNLVLIFLLNNAASCSDFFEFQRCRPTAERAPDLY